MQHVFSDWWRCFSFACFLSIYMFFSRPTCYRVKDILYITNSLKLWVQFWLIYNENDSKLRANSSSAVLLFVFIFWPNTRLFWIQIFLHCSLSIYSNVNDLCVCVACIMTLTLPPLSLQSSLGRDSCKPPSSAVTSCTSPSLHCPAARQRKVTLTEQTQSRSMVADLCELRWGSAFILTLTQRTLFGDFQGFLSVD